MNLGFLCMLTTVDIVGYDIVFKEIIRYILKCVPKTYVRQLFEFSFLFVVLGFEPMASYLLDKCSTIELHPSLGRCISVIQKLFLIGHSGKCL